jgi:hypothetical protein
MGPLVAAPAIAAPIAGGAAAGGAGLTMAHVGAAGLGMQGIGMGIQGSRSKKQHKRSKKQMEKQFRLQQRLNEQGHELGLEMWRKTNYPAQVEMMKEAGLNPALMYQQGGTPGTTSQPSGGNASGGAAPVMPHMDMSGMLMGAQAAKLLAETDKIKEETGLTKEKVLETIANSKNIDADTEVKAEQKLQTISERKLTESMTRLNKLKEDKGVTGSAINDLMNNLGLDPTNNEVDKWVVRGMLVTHFGIDNLTKIARMFPKKVGEQILKWFNIQ